MSILIDQIVEVQITNRNITNFKNLGYQILDNKASVAMKHLPKSTRARINCYCDYCGQEYKTSFDSTKNSKNTFCSIPCKNNHLKGSKRPVAKRTYVSCYNCGEQMEKLPWQLKKTDTPCCSVKCADTYRKGKQTKKRFIVNCSTCNSPIQKTLKEIRKNNYCSSICSLEMIQQRKNANIIKRRIKYRSKPKTRVKTKEFKKTIKMNKVKCDICKRYYNRPVSYNNKNSKSLICSKACKSQWIRSTIAISKEKVTVNCHICSTVLYRNESIVRKNKWHFCSRICYGKFRREELVGEVHPHFRTIKLTCKQCNKQFDSKPSHKATRRNTFCGTECYAKYRHIYTIEMLKKRQLPGSMTLPHRLVVDMLNKLKINFEIEKRYGRFSLDIYLPDLELFIEVMGDYWHASPVIYSKKSINNHQLKSIDRDKRKQELIKSKTGSDILYLWEKDIKYHEDKCIAIIESYCRQTLTNFHSFNFSLNDEKLILNDTILKAYFND